MYNIIMVLVFCHCAYREEQSWNLLNDPRITSALSVYRHTTQLCSDVEYLTSTKCKCTKHQFIHLLTASCNEWHIKNCKKQQKSEKGDITHHPIA